MNLTADQNDLLCELLNIGVGRAAASLNALIESQVALSVPQVRLTSVEELPAGESESMAAIQMGFDGAFMGVSSLVFTASSAAKLATLLLCDEDDPLGLDALRVGALCEVGNILLNAVLGSIGNILSADISYTVPEYSEGSLIALLESGVDDAAAQILIAEVDFGVEEHHLAGSVLFCFEIGSLRPFCEALDGVLLNA